MALGCGDQSKAWFVPPALQTPLSCGWILRAVRSEGDKKSGILLSFFFSEIGRISPHIISENCNVPTL